MQLRALRKKGPFSFTVEQCRLGDQENDHRKPGSEAGRCCQHLPAMAPRAIDAGSPALGDQGCVELG